MKFILRYCNLRGNKPSPLFCQADNTPITVNQFNSELRRCLNFCGLNVQRYIKVTAFASVLPVSQQTKVFLTPRFALLADGSLMPLNFSFLILHYKEFSFAWVRHGLPCILFVELFAPLRGFSTSLVVTHGLHHDAFIARALKNRNISQCGVCMR